MTTGGEKNQFPFKIRKKKKITLIITDAVDVLFGYVADVVQTERVVFPAKIQLQIVVAIVVVDRYAHLEHLRTDEKNSVRSTDRSRCVAQNQISLTCTSYSFMFGSTNTGSYRCVTYILAILSLYALYLRQ